MNNIRRLVYFCLIFVVSFTSLPCFNLYAQEAGAVYNLPVPGSLVMSQGDRSFPVLKGIKINPNEPLKLEFIIDSRGQTVSREEAAKLIDYFLACLTIPSQDLWVNLSPYEQNRIAPNSLCETQLGKDLLGQDYVLKQLAASLTYPQSETGKEYWQAVNNSVIANAAKQAQSFNKIWIMPNKAQVYEGKDFAYVSNVELKCLHESDYLAAIAENRPAKLENSLDKQALKKYVLPSLDHEVNYGQRFAQLRQVANSFALAVWFKRKLKDTLFAAYIGKNKIKGIDLEDKAVKENIYNLYVESFKKGAYSITQKAKVKTQNFSGVQKIVARSYFSGGVVLPEEAIGIKAADEGQGWQRVVADGDVVVKDQLIPAEKLDGPAMRWSGKGLNAQENKIVNDAIAEYFPNNPSSNAVRIKTRQQLKRGIATLGVGDYRKLDPQGVLRANNVNIFILPGLLERINEIAKERGEEPPSDLVVHPGRGRRNLYLDPTILQTVLAKDEIWRAAWANHEWAHIQNPKANEEVVQKIAPLPATKESIVALPKAAANIPPQAQALLMDFRTKSLDQKIAAMRVLAQFVGNPSVCRRMQEEIYFLETPQEVWVIAQLLMDTNVYTPVQAAPLFPYALINGLNEKQKQHILGFVISQSIGRAMYDSYSRKDLFQIVERRYPLGRGGPLHPVHAAIGKGGMVDDLELTMLGLIESFDQTHIDKIFEYLAPTIIWVAPGQSRQLAQPRYNLDAMKKFPRTLAVFASILRQPQFAAQKKQFMTACPQFLLDSSLIPPQEAVPFLAARLGSGAEYWVDPEYVKNSTDPEGDRIYWAQEDAKRDAAKRPFLNYVIKHGLEAQVLVELQNRKKNLTPQYAEEEAKQIAIYETFLSDPDGEEVTQKRAAFPDVVGSAAKRLGTSTVPAIPAADDDSLGGVALDENNMEVVATGKFEMHVSPQLLSEIEKSSGFSHEITDMRLVDRR